MTIIEAIKKYVQIPMQVELAKVEKVEEEYVKVSLLADKDIMRVARYSAVLENNKNTIKTIPSVGSIVLTGMIENEPQSCYLVQCNDVESVKVEIENTILEINKDGYNISREGKDLNTLVADLIDVVTAIVVVQGKGPDIGKLQAIKQDLNTILKA